MSNVEELPVVARKLSEYDALVAAAPGALGAIPGAVCLCDHEGWLVSLIEKRERFCGSHRLFLIEGTPLAHEDCPILQFWKSTWTISRSFPVADRSYSAPGMEWPAWLLNSPAILYLASLFR